MKTFIPFTLLLFNFANSALAGADILCSLNKDDTHYKLSLESKKIKKKETIFVMMIASSLSAISQNNQRQHIVGTQLFSIEVESDVSDLIHPLIKSNYSKHEFDFTKIIFLDEGPEDITLKISGPVLENELIFTNCLIAEKN